MTVSKYEGTQLMKVTSFRITSSQNSEAASRFVSLIMTVPPPPSSGSIACSMDAWNAQEMKNADRKSVPTLNRCLSEKILFAKLACATATPFGSPEDPEV